MPRGQLRRSLRELIADSQRAAVLRERGLPYHVIGQELGVSRNTASRLVWWHADMLAAWGGFPRNRARRLPFRHGRSWDRERFERLVAERAKVVEAMRAQEALDRAERTQRAAAEATRNAEKDRRDQALDWLEKGGEPPAWLVEALIAETLTRRKSSLRDRGTAAPP
jgi:hypothetical protein